MNRIEELESESEEIKQNEK